MLNKMQKKIEDNFPFILIFLSVLFFEIFFYQRLADELTIYNNFHAQYHELNFGNFLAFLVDTMKKDILQWSSRTIIDFVSIIMIFCIPLWEIVNALLYAVLAKSLCVIFDFKKLEYVIITTAMIGVVPQTLYLGAGWLMTSIAYFWPVVLAVATFALFLNREKKYSRFRLILSGLCILYAANEEIMCIVLVAAFPVLMFTRREYIKPACVMEGIVILELLWALFCPGNRGRSLAEEGRWFADFSTLSVVKKMELGFSTTMKEYLLDFNFIFFILACVIFALGIKKGKDVLSLFITPVPLLAALFGGLIEAFDDKIDIFNTLKNSCEKYGTISMYSYDNAKRYLPIVFYIIVGGCVLISILIIGEYSKASIGVAILLLFGVASRCAMGFSPTVWGSGPRTYSILYFLFVIVILAGIKMMKESQMKRVLQVITMLISVGCMVEVSRFIMAFAS